MNSMFINRLLYMRKNVLLGALYICSILIISCENNQEIEYVVQIPGLSAIDAELKLVDTLRIKLDSLTSPENYYGHIRYIDNQPYYCILNGYTNTIQAYHLFDSLKYWQVQIPMEGPNSSPKIDRAYVHNKDSIFTISDDFNHRVYLYNSVGVLTNTYNIPLKGDFKNYWTYHDYFYDFVYQPKYKTVGFWMYPDNQASEDGYEYYKMAKAARFNIETDSIQAFGHFPNVYFRDNNLYENFEYYNSYEVADLNILYFAASSEIQVYDLNSCKLINTFQIPSKWIDEPIIPHMKLLQERPELREGSKYLQKTGYYAKMLSNKEGTLHYRIVKHPVELKYSDGSKRNWNDQPFSIMVLDKDFKIILEKKFKGGIYDFWQVFAVENKIYISINNTLNDYANDDYLQFAVFSLR